MEFKEKICCICLVMDVQLFAFVKSEVKQFIENIFRDNGFHKDMIENLNICYECKALLVKTFKFIQRALTAQQILHELYKESNEITLDQLKSINRQELCLDTNLTIHEKNIDFYFTDKRNLLNEDETYVRKRNNVENNELQEDECKLELDDSSIDDPLQDYHVEWSGVKYESDQTPDPLLNNIVKVKVSTRLKLPLDNKCDVTTFDDSDMEDYSKILPDQNNDTEIYENCIKIEKHRRKKITKDKIKRNQKPPKKQNETSGSGVKKYVSKRKSYEPSVFILNLASYADKKRERKVNKYVCSDDSDSSITRKLKNTYVPTKEFDWEFKPKSFDDSDDSSDSTYDRYDDLGRHMKKPDNRSYPMKCDHCEAEIPAKKVHYQHYLCAHPQIPYPYAREKLNLLCQFCGYVSHKKALHEAHELTHGSKSDFACHKCPKRFKNKIRLRRHIMRTHTEAFLHCDYCGKKFKTRADIVLHLRIHTGEKPFKCHICGAGFAHKGNVGIHIRSKHQGQSAQPKKNNNNFGQNRRTCSTVEEEDEDQPLINTKKTKVATTKTTKIKNKSKTKKKSK